MNEFDSGEKNRESTVSDPAMILCDGETKEKPDGDNEQDICGKLQLSKAKLLCDPNLVKIIHKREHLRME